MVLRDVSIRALRELGVRQTHLSRYAAKMGHPASHGWVVRSPVVEKRIPPLRASHSGRDDSGFEDLWCE